MVLPETKRSEAQSFRIIAHRGFSSQYPENTLAAFDAAAGAGFPHMELDAQLTSDGVPVVLHDGDLQRVSGAGQTKPIAECTAAEAAGIDVGSWFDEAFAAQRIPQLADVLCRFLGRAHLHLELKSQQPALPAAVAAALQGASWLADPAVAQGAAAPDAFAVPGLTITSFHLEQLRRSLKELPGVRHGWLVQEIDGDILRQAAAARVQGLYPRANAATPAATAAALAAGHSVRAWGVKDLQLLRHARACGAQGATVNWPDEAQAALGGGGGAPAP